MEYPAGMNTIFAGGSMNGSITKELGLAFCTTLGDNIHIRSQCPLELGNLVGLKAMGHRPFISREMRSKMVQEKREYSTKSHVCYEHSNTAIDFMPNSCYT